jgi:hypothetical protein
MVLLVIHLTYDIKGAFMLSSGLRTQIKLYCQAVIASIFIAAPITTYAIEEVYVPGTRPGEMTGLEYMTYLNNQATAEQLRALYQGLVAEALAKAAAAKKTEEEMKQDTYRRCMDTAEISHKHCLSNAASYKATHNQPCNYLASTVGNMPYANPTAACYTRVLDQFDLYVANCNLFDAIARADCAK